MAGIPQNALNGAKEAEEAAYCYERRLEGATTRRCAALATEHFGYPISEPTVRRRLAWAYADRVDPLREQWIAVHTDRLEAVFASLVPRVRAGDPQAVAAALRALERQAKLLGLDAPVRAAVEVTHDTPVDAAVRELVEQVEARNAAMETGTATP